MDPQEILKGHGFRSTKPRRLLLAFLLQCDGLSSLSNLYAALSEEVDRATVYRTLKAFVEQGLLHTFAGPENETYYELCSHGHHDGQPHNNHGHFLCLYCKQVHCIEGMQPPSLKAPEGFETEEVVLVLKGKCRGCKENR